jgi:hypothetical protein
MPDIIAVGDSSSATVRRAGHVGYRHRMDPTDETFRHTDEDALQALEPDPSRRRRTGGGLGDTIGGALVGFDYQVFGATKPPAILVESAKPVRGLSGQGGAMLSIDFPEDTPTSDAKGSG